AEIEAGPADQHRRAAPTQHVLDGRAGVPLIGGDAGGATDVQHVQQMVVDAPALGDGELGGADVHPAVQLHGVAVDDLAVPPLGYVQGQIRLPGRGGTPD